MNEYLDKRTEQKLIGMGNKKYHKALLLTIGWVVLIVAFWLLFMILASRSFLAIANYLPLVLCVLPFFLTYKILFSKTFYASVTYTVSSTQFQQLKEAYVRDRPETVEILEVHFKRDDGKEFALSYKKKNYVMDGIHYDSGDRVFFVRGLNYPVELPITDAIERTCPMCGRTIEAGDMACQRCKFDFRDLIR